MILCKLYTVKNTKCEIMNKKGDKIFEWKIKSFAHQRSLMRLAHINTHTHKKKATNNN